MKPVTVASVRTHGVHQRLVYCHGKREGDWPCNHSAKLPINRFGTMKRFRTFNAAAVARLADRGKPISGRTIAFNKRRGRVLAG
jgi:hypothetical protein